MAASREHADLVLHETAIAVNGEHVDPYADDAAKRLCELLGPVVKTSPAGLKGVPRTAHWLASGIVVVSDNTAKDALVMIFVCFDREDSSPYPQWVSTVEPFVGAVKWDDRVFSAGVDERTVLGIPGIEGYGGMRHVKAGRLMLMFTSKKQRGPTGLRMGRRMLVQVCAQWTRTARASAAVGEPWAD